MPDNLQGALASGVAAELAAKPDDEGRPFRPTTRPRMVGGDRDAMSNPPEANIRADLMLIATEAKGNAQAIRTIAAALGIDGVPEVPDYPVKDSSNPNVSLRDIMAPLNDFVLDAKIVLDRINRAL